VEVIRLQQVVRGVAATEVGGAHTTVDRRETGAREGALVLGASRGAEGLGDCR